MTESHSFVPPGFVRAADRAKAEIKYDLNYLENRLKNYAASYANNTECPDEVYAVCEAISHRYQDYLNLVDEAKHLSAQSFTCPNIWTLQVQELLALKLARTQAQTVEEERTVLLRLAVLYEQFKKTLHQHNHVEATDFLSDLVVLFQQKHLKDWMGCLVALWNKHDAQQIMSEAQASNKQHTLDWFIMLHDLALEQLIEALHYFSKTELVDLVNAIFFYKMYPDKLFNVLIHPDKLVSVRTRLGVMHHFIELIQMQLYHCAQQHGLNAGIDYLFHGDALPQGIMLEVHEEHRALIQSALKHFKITPVHESESQIALDRLHDLARAYKFWFNPNRLIDAAMVLEQRLVQEKRSEDEDLLVFHQEMIYLYKQLTTTECLDLYGYFANKDSCYLMGILIAAAQGECFEWLPERTDLDKNALLSVFNALQQVMEALRVELKNRHITTEPYEYIHSKQQLHVGRRNREAILRSIAVYGAQVNPVTDSLESLFSLLEG